LSIAHFCSPYYERIIKILQKKSKNKKVSQALGVHVNFVGGFFTLQMACLAPRPASVSIKTVLLNVNYQSSCRDRRWHGGQ